MAEFTRLRACYTKSFPIGVIIRYLCGKKGRVTICVEILRLLIRIGRCRQGRLNGITGENSAMELVPAQPFVEIEMRTIDKIPRYISIGTFDEILIRYVLKNKYVAHRNVYTRCLGAFGFVGPLGSRDSMPVRRDGPECRDLTSFVNVNVTSYRESA